MAKKFGEIVSDLEGVDGQLLRIKNDGTGFEFTDPATIPDYTITNTTTDRVLNADETTIDELADVLGTLIADLEAAGLTGGSAGLEAFQWSTSEQVWPFEKDASGNTIYCKQINFGALPNSGSKTVAHGLTNFKMWKVKYEVDRSSDQYTLRLNYANTSNNSLHYIYEHTNADDVFIGTGIDYSTYDCVVFLKYTKTA